MSGYNVPVYFLDTDLEQNAAPDRTITDHLYGGDQRYRLCQETVLGISGVRMLRALGYGGNGGHNEIRRFHMNEGHAALLTLELAYELSRQAWDMAYEQTKHTITTEMVHLVKPKCIFTTHTPVPAGQDKFPLDLVHQVITGYQGVFAEREQEFCPDGVLNMTYLALDNSHYINGVAKSHGHVAQQMFSKHDIHSITNGVPSFSILDGWWGEGCIEGVTGWAIGGNKDASMESRDTRAEDAHVLYNKLEMIILPMFCNEQDRYAEVMRHSIALNASFFNTERMLSQYITKAYFK